MDIREEVKYIVDEYFEFEFDTKQLPMTRTEFIDTLENQIQKLIQKSHIERLIAETNEPMFPTKTLMN